MSVRRKRGIVCGKALNLGQLLIVGKVKGLVLDDAAAEISAELMTTECRRFSFVEEVACIERAVAMEVISAAVDLVGARLGDRVDHATGAAAVFGRVAVGQNRKFAVRVHAH